MLFLKLLLFFNIVVFINSARSKPLCGRSKISGNCYCFKEINDSSGFLELHIDCASLNLSKFPDSSQIPTHIVAKLSVSHNALKELNFNDVDFASESLWSLVASYNEIERVSEEFLNAQINLVDIDLNHNLITKFGSEKEINLPHLRSLDLSFNNLTSFNSSLANFPKLRTLDLSYNDLGNFLVSQQQPLIGLNVNISNLELNSVNLKEIPRGFFENFTQLHRLGLADNDLKTIPKIPDSIKYLDLSGNLFISLEANDLNYKSIKSLKFNRLHLLETIGNYAFYTMTSLESLELTNNPKLKELNPLAFGLLDAQETLGLKKLHLAGNNLRKWNVTYQYLLRGLDEVTLHNNPWICDCEIQWMYLQFHKLRYSSQVRCAAPARLCNRRLEELQTTDFTYCTNSRGKQLQRILVPTIIVLILILLPLIAYLVFKGPMAFKNLTTRRLGPQSPYEGIPTTPREN